MAARSFVQLLGAPDPGVVVLGFSFFPQGTGAISSSQIVGRGVASVAWNAGTNRYVVTLADQYASLLSVHATLQLATPDDKFLQIGAVSATNKTIEIVVWDVSGAAGTSSIAANAGNEINVLVIAKNSSV